MCTVPGVVQSESDVVYLSIHMFLLLVVVSVQTYGSGTHS